MKIKALELHTNHSLEVLADFYTDLLERPPLEHSDSTLKLNVGASQLAFQRGETPETHYHFAISIPENQFVAAKIWLAKKVPLIRVQDGQEVFYSENWDANMVYFYDPAGNVLELIARHTLANSSDEPFRAASLLSISEIGIAATDVAEQVRAIQAKIGVSPYRWLGEPTFVPLGDENGLFIVVKEGRIWFPDTSVAAEHLPLTVTVEQEGHATTLSFG